MRHRHRAPEPAWYRFFPEDWWEGCYFLSLEEEGLYKRVCTYMYRTQAPLTADDSAAAKLLNVQVLKYRKVLQSLIDKGKLIRAQGHIINERVIEEIEWSRSKFDRMRKANEKRSASMIKTIAKQVEESRLREAADADQMTNNPYPRDDGTRGVTPPVTPPVQYRLPPQLPPELPMGLTDKKVNKINEPREVQGEVRGEVGRGDNRERDRVKGESEYLEESHNQVSTMSETSSDVCGSDAPEQKPKAKKPKGSRYPEAFEALWADYPETWGMSKTKAYTAWKQLSGKAQVLAHEALPALKRYMAESRKRSPGMSYLHVSTYLNQRRWETLVRDGASRKGGGSWWENPSKVSAISEERWRDGVRRLANGVWPVDKLGPPPGHANCVVPKAIVDEFRLLENYTPDGIKVRQNA